MSDGRDISRDPIWHPFTTIPHSGPRGIFARAQGAYVTDTAGRSFYDATSSWWCVLHGHCHPRLVEALRRQAGELDQILLAPHTHLVADALAKKLLERTNGTFSKVFFSDNGSTA